LPDSVTHRIESAESSGSKIAVRHNGSIAQPILAAS